MAKITFGPSLSEARGKAADTVYTKARGGNVAKALSLKAQAVGPHNLLSITHPDTTPATPPVRGDIITGQGATTLWKRLAKGTPGQVLGCDADDVKWVEPPAGGVTSVGLALPPEFDVTGSPVTSEGTLTGAWTQEDANKVFAGPAEGAADTPAFRALVAADIPSISKPPTQTIILTGTTVYNTPDGCKAILVELLGAGGGGGGAATAGSANGAAGGGGSGGYARKLIASPAASYTVAVGAKGTGGAAGQNDGNAGGNTTWGSPATITAYGGVGGKGAAANGTINTIYAGGAGGAPSLGGDLNFAGNAGGRSIKLASVTILSSGQGGNSAFGGGGQARTTAGQGNSAAGFGAGGGGAQSSTTTAYAGGDGSDGVIIVTEYY
jgi:hypothetical protein